MPAATANSANTPITASRAKSPITHGSASWRPMNRNDTTAATMVSAITTTRPMEPAASLRSIGSSASPLFSSPMVTTGFPPS